MGDIARRGKYKVSLCGDTIAYMTTGHGQEELGVH